MVKESSNIECSSFTREKDVFFVASSSSVVSIFVVVDFSIRSVNVMMILTLILRKTTALFALLFCSLFFFEESKSYVLIV